MTKPAVMLKASLALQNRQASATMEADSLFQVYEEELLPKCEEVLLNRVRTCTFLEKRIVIEEAE